MLCQAGVDQGLLTIMSPLSPLRTPQATVLALWSLGMVLARSCALTAVSHLVAQGMPRQEQTVRQPRRAWIEQGFTIPTRAGWPWHRTRMPDPARAARLWLAVAVATWWWLRVGGEADETMPTRTLRDVTALGPARARTRRATRRRLVSVLRQGWGALWVAWLRQEPLPAGRFVPDPWPAGPAWDATTGEPPLALPAAA